ncbi:MAG TPA: hypothetical protein VEC37_05710, partial [Bacillota bacterium]|nr:hypothetical protein [Bacillota bacterium]
MLKLKRLLALIIVVLAIQFLPVRLYADDPFKLMAEGKPAYTMKEVKNYVCKIVPLVENATGKKFLKIPRLVFADRKKMTKVLSRELMEPLSNLYPQLARDQINRMSQSQAALASMNLMGKYGVKDGKLYLLPKNMLPLLNLAEVDEKHTKSLLQLVIAHELTHALQDQETDLKRCYKITDIDRFSAFSATMEGQAVWVQEKVGRQLGLDDSVVEMSRLLSAGTIKFDDPAV